jgi:putative addiction module killer protein
MTQIRKTETFAQWLDELCDVRARARVQVRIERLAAGNAGDVEPVGEGVSELRVDYGPGYRVYFT